MEGAATTSLANVLICSTLIGVPPTLSLTHYTGSQTLTLDRSSAWQHANRIAWIAVPVGTRPPRHKVLIVCPRETIAWSPFRILVAFVNARLQETILQLGLKPKTTSFASLLTGTPPVIRVHISRSSSGKHARKEHLALRSIPFRNTKLATGASLITAKPRLLILRGTALDKASNNILLLKIAARPLNPDRLDLKTWSPLAPNKGTPLRPADKAGKSTLLVPTVLLTPSAPSLSLKSNAALPPLNRISSKQTPKVVKARTKTTPTCSKLITTCSCPCLVDLPT